MTDEESERLHAIWKKYIIPKQCRFDIIDLITDIEAERDALREALKIARQWMPVHPIEDAAKSDCALVDAALQTSSATVPVPRSVPSSPEVHVSQVSTEAKSPKITKPWGWDRVPG